ncbi:cytochrome P450 [Streptomyces sp. AV19]|uniref:cytochrome P450 n=1 Tax=Streptomyces sp. AV19 TaxID=2793068 RepID=UPI0018FEB6EC|nr:cytochrome P450 [Streptomyces sp. AV19]MBH1937763.1 cytochrome P450 [Streptomyces sp. AV19]MDG4533651.1 cytochrome P450 [Streptomyces sp. AV19]
MSQSHSTMPSGFTFGVARGALPVIGHLRKFLWAPLDFLESLPSAGDLVEVRLGTRRAYVACHPELVRRVFADSRLFGKDEPQLKESQQTYGSSLATAPDDQHRRLRRLLQPAFDRSGLAQYGALLERKAALLAGGWQDGQVVDVFPAFCGFATDAVSRALFPGRLGDECLAEVRNLFRKVSEAGEGVGVAAVLTLLRGMNGGRRRRKAVQQLCDVLDRLIVECRAGGSDESDDAFLLSPLFAASAQHSEAETDRMSGPEPVLTDEEVRAQALSLLAAGTHTVATALTWTFHLLSQHPRVERHLHEEVDSVLGGRPAAWADLGSLAFTEHVVTEALRLYPPVWLLMRVTAADATVAGRRLPAGSLILPSPLAVQRRGDIFARPHVFDPDRWLPHRAAAYPRGSFCAFGGGAHKCIGDSFGMAEAVLTLATVAQSWRLRAAPGADLRTNPVALAVHPRRLPMSVHARR